MKEFAIVLSGCCVYDGAEIHESVTAMLAICRRGCKYQVFASDIPHRHVINYLTGEEMSEKRGCKHFVTTHGEVTVDKKNKVAATPCYMLDANIAQVAQGAENIVDELLKLM